MSIDLPLTPQSPAPAVAPRIGKGGNSPLEAQQAIQVDDGEFINLLSAMDGESSFQAERPSTRPGSDLQQSREGKPDSASEPRAPDTNGVPKGLDPLTVNASFVNLTWPVLFLRIPQETDVSKADGAAQSSPGQATNGEGNSVSPREDGGAWPANILQQQSIEHALAADGGRSPRSQTSFPLDAQSGIDVRRQQGRPENTVVTANVLQRHAIDQTLARDDERPPNSQLSSPLNVPPEIDATRQQGRPENTVVMANVLQRHAIEQTLASDGERPPISQLSFPRGVQPEIDATRQQGRPESAVVMTSAEAILRGTLQHENVGHETIQHVTISSLETHFPIVLSSMLVEQARISNDNGPRTANILIAPAPQIAEAGRQIGAPTKILNIELEPASLGAVTVRMKISRSNVDVQIKVESAEALNALNNTRDKLVEAIRSSGCTVDSCTVGFAPASTSSSQLIGAGGGQELASSSSEARSHANIGQQGADHGGRNDNPKETPRNPWERLPDSGSSRGADRTHGLYL